MTQPVKVPRMEKRVADMTRKELASTIERAVIFAILGAGLLISLFFGLIAVIRIVAG